MSLVPRRGRIVGAFSGDREHCPDFRTGLFSSLLGVEHAFDAGDPVS